MYLWLTSSDRSDVVSPRHDLVWSQACLVYDRTCCWFHLMGFLVFSWCMVEMIWDCWTTFILFWSVVSACNGTS